MEVPIIRISRELHSALKGNAAEREMPLYQYVNALLWGVLGMSEPKPVKAEMKKAQARAWKKRKAKKARPVPEVPAPSEPELVW